ncbi:TPA: hypothetical protein I7203_16455 [Vibrio vulnificus]|nr:hypothetical protein [Vibrio vulnificus]HDY8237961.1 hypothetical protein [Vibrio vulnificus]
MIAFPDFGPDTNLPVKVFKKYSKLISELTARCFEMNMTTDNHIFIHFSGHVALVDIDIYIGGWDDLSRPKKFATYLSHDQSNEKAITKWFRDVNKYLDSIE